MIHVCTSLINALPFEWSHYAFMQHALLAVILISPLFALLGCMVVNNQMAFFSDAIGHAGLTGIALGVIIGIANPLGAMIVFALGLAIVITLLRRYSAASGDTTIGIVMSCTVAIGIVLLSRQGGFNRYTQYLIGDLLSITGSDLWMLTIVDALFALVWIFAFNKLFLVSTSATLARSRGQNVWLWQGFFAAITAVIVTISIQWVGILVINALIILPASAARIISRTNRQYIASAGLISLVCGICGLIASYYWSTATGATIVLFCMAAYVGLLVFARMRKL